MKVYQFEHSPFCIPVTRALEALGVPFEVCNVSNGDRREIIELTNGAYYQVPVIAHDGRIVYETAPDSQEVARYLDGTFGDGRLFPAKLDGLQSILIAHVENEVEGVTFRLVDPPYLAEMADVAERTMIVRHKERKFGAGCVAKWAADREELTRQTEALLKPYDQILQHSAFLLGAEPVYVDFLLYGILGNLTYRDYNPLPAGQAALGEWFGRMRTFRFDG